MVVLLNDPIMAAFAPDVFPPSGWVGLREQTVFFLASLLIASGLVGLVSWRLRRLATLRSTQNAASCWHSRP